MSATQLSISNLALSRIGQKPLTATDQSGVSAAACTLFYDQTRQWLLRKFPWNFAKATAALVVTETEPLGWEYEYTLPTDYLRVWAVTDETGGASGELVRAYINGEMVYVASRLSTSAIPYEIREGVLLTNLEDAYIIYEKDEDDETTFDSMFIDTFSWRLAYEIAMPITGKFAIRKEALNGYMQSTIQSGAADAMERHVVNTYQSDILAARR